MRTKFLFVLFIIFAGCSTSKGPAMDKDKLPVVVDGVSDLYITQLEQKLMSKGVKIITTGQMYLISVPTKLLFADESPKLLWPSYALLNDIAAYLRMFRKISVHVNGYNDCYLTEKRTRVLTLARANEVANYLWSQDIRSRLIFTRGMGNDKPIVILAKCSDASQNSRIEIIFRRVIV